MRGTLLFVMRAHTDQLYEEREKEAKRERVCEKDADFVELIDAIAFVISIIFVVSRKSRGSRGVEFSSPRFARIASKGWIVIKIVIKEIPRHGPLFLSGHIMVGK